jgi:hypothetical protein
LLGLVSIGPLLRVGETNVADDTATVVQGSAADDASVRAVSGRIPFLFVPKAGQMDARGQYSGRGPGYRVY